MPQLDRAALLSAGVFPRHRSRGERALEAARPCARDAGTACCLGLDCRRAATRCLREGCLGDSPCCGRNPAAHA
jgi:hypothetical protein